MDRPASSAGQHQNRLLALLPELDRSHVLQAAEPCRPGHGEAVCEPGEPMKWAYFPLTNVFSAVVPLDDGSVIEAATIGREGVVGIDLLAGRSAAVYRVINQVPGEALRLRAAVFQELLASNEPLRRVVEKYALTLVQMSGQTAACNLRHPVVERMCRWLLMTRDRSGDSFYLTQEFLSIMLGVRRQTVGIEAARLQEAGLITYSRGNVTVHDCPGLEAATCECYAAVRDGYERVMRGADGRGA